MVIRKTKRPPSLLPRRSRHHKGRNAIMHEVNPFGRIGKMLTNFVGDHLRIGNHQTRPLRTEKMLFKSQRLLVLQTEPPKNRLPPRLKTSSMLQPSRVDTVARPVSVALPNTLQTKKKVARFTRVGR